LRGFKKDPSPDSISEIIFKGNLALRYQPQKKRKSRLFQTILVIYLHELQGWNTISTKKLKA
jgi:hypothetical protein